ncbi:cysteine proteinase inhibitor 1-like [Prunus avium]|uniref:Cysteine proteinase inhibitor 1-like n=1 Tax=Prunus avium TaxID=42229 RepID=A0A6P5U0N7_PRUAV|nr:cysteine proteinase inhibitor 1-like [Prunus avium]
MRPQLQWLLLALIGLLLPLMLVAATTPSQPLAGGWKPIAKENIIDPRLKLMADFTVSMYNLRTHKKLFVVRVVCGDTQIAAGQNYRLVVLAKDGQSLPNSTIDHAHYELRVYEKLWEDLWKLVSFVNSTIEQN